MAAVSTGLWARTQQQVEVSAPADCGRLWHPEAFRTLPRSFHRLLPSPSVPGDDQSLPWQLPQLQGRCQVAAAPRGPRPGSGCARSPHAWPHSGALHRAHSWHPPEWALSQAGGSQAWLGRADSSSLCSYPGGAVPGCFGQVPSVARRCQVVPAHCALTEPKRLALILPDREQGTGAKS